MEATALHDEQPDDS